MVMTELLSLWAPLSAAGILAGLLAGLFGIGGGLVVVPVCYFILLSFGMTEADAMAMSIGTSLAAIIPTGISSAMSHNKLQNIRWDIVKSWSGPLVLGTLLGSTLVAFLRTKWFVLSFSLLLFVLAYRKLRTALSEAQHEPVAQSGKPLRGGLIPAAACAIGAVSAIAGVGGGSLAVPFLVSRGLGIHRAIGTSAVLGVFIAVPATLNLLLFSQTPLNAPATSIKLLYWPALLILLPLSVLTAPFGARLGKRISDKWMRFAFALLLLGVATKMATSVI